MEGKSLELELDRPRCISSWVGSTPEPLFQTARLAFKSFSLPSVSLLRSTGISEEVIQRGLWLISMDSILGMTSLLVFVQWGRDDSGQLDDAWSLLKVGV